jgi:hypothetical protein
MALPVDVMGVLVGGPSVGAAERLAGVLSSVDDMEGLVGGLTSAGGSSDGLSERR